MALEQLIIGDLQVAEANLRQSVNLDKDIHNEQQQSFDNMELGRLLSYLGDWDSAENELSQAETIIDQHGGARQTNLASVVRAYRAYALLLMQRDTSKPKFNNLSLAVELAQHSLKLAEETASVIHRYPTDFVRAHWLLGAAYRARNQLGLAETHLSEALIQERAINLVQF